MTSDTNLSFAAMSALLLERLEALPRPLRILEAGCGRNWPLKLSAPFTLTGVDLDPDALAARTDLDRAVIGDLRTVEFPPHSFDVIYNAFVLEHVRGARAVLERFVRWLAPGGMLILMVPDRNSAYGFLTRMTPFWAHVMVYRHLLHYPRAGTPGHGPYPTYYDEVVSERGLREFCRGHGLTAPELHRMCSYANDRVLKSAAFLTSALSLGRLDWRHNNLLLIAQTRRERNLLELGRAAHATTPERPPAPQELEKRPMQWRLSRSSCGILLSLAASCLAGVAPGSAAEAPYTVKPGDQLQISVWREPELEKQNPVLVEPDGTFTFPLCGQIDADGKTVTQLANEMAAKLAHYMTDPVVTVSLGKINGNIVYVIGQVTHPGAFVVNPDVNVMQALSMAGGTTPFASLGSIKVLRSTAAGTQVALAFDYNDVIHGNSLSQNITLKAGDVVVVP